MVPTDLQLLGLLIATLLGALTSAGLGWADAGGAFDLRKFLPSVGRGIIAAVGIFIATYTGFTGEVTLFTCLGAFGIGLGFDAGWNRLAGAISR